MPTMKILSNESSDSSTASNCSKQKKKQAVRDLGVDEIAPAELELKIQTQRVLYILSKAVQKLEIACSLPTLLKHNACGVVEHLAQDDVNFILGACMKYVGDVTTSLLHLKKCTRAHIIDNISMNILKRKTSSKLGYGSKADLAPDPYMADVMDILWKNLTLRQHILETNLFSPHAVESIFINWMRCLKEVAGNRFSTTAQQEKAQEKRLKKAYIITSQFGSIIKATRQALEKQRQELGNQLQAKQAIVNKYQSKIQVLKSNFKDDALHIMHVAEEEMTEDMQASEARQEELATEAKATTQQYETLLHEHMLHEKNLRNKRARVATQLLGWLTKYDADIGERQAEFDEITKGMLEEKRELDSLQEKFNDQEVEYNTLKAEKEELELKVFQEKFYIFLRNRAARRIQRSWRRYYQRKLERKKAQRNRRRAKKQAEQVGKAKSVEKVTASEEIKEPSLVQIYDAGTKESRDEITGA